MAIMKTDSKTILDFNFLGMRVTADKTILYGSAVIFLIAAVLAYFLAKLTVLDSIFAGVLAVFLHWLGEIIHQYGHFLAAKAVGHPMIGVRLWTVLGMSLYPKNEGELPAGIHIRRALGGPAISFVVLFIGIALWYFMGSFSPMLNFLLLWIIAEQVLIYAGGALLPVNFSWLTVDGGTILYWLRKK